MYRISLLLLMSTLVLMCHNPQTERDQAKILKYQKRNAAQDMHPGWTEQYWREKTEEGHERPEMISAMMREAQSPTYRFKSATPGLKEITEVGPDNIAGRVRAIAQDIQNSNRLLAGAISGGIWESLDKGESWTPLTDQDQNLSVTGITQSPSDPNIWYYSSGEVTGNSASISGPGVFRSADNGKTWSLLPATMISAFTRTWRIKCSIDNPDLVFVAGPDGLFMLEEGGEFVTQLLFENVTDLHITSRGDMYAAVSGQGVYWAAKDDYTSIAPRVNDNLPNGGWSRCIIGVHEVDEFPENDILYTLIQDTQNNRLKSFHRSDNGGDLWVTRFSPEASGITFNFTWYCLTLGIHPTDPDKVAVGSVGVGYTLNGGISWNTFFGGHVDRHVIQWDIADDDRFFIGSDGGIDYIYADPAGPWTRERTLNNGLNITQFYTGAAHPTLDVALGGTQDNGTLISNEMDQFGDRVYGGDGSYCAIDPQNPDRAYASFQNGNIFRTENLSNPFRNWVSIQNELDADGDGSIDEGASFINPYYLHPTRPNLLFFMTRQRVWFSENFGTNWAPLTDQINGTHVVALDTSDSGATRVLVGGASGGLFFIRDLAAHEPGDEIPLKSILPRSVNRGFVGQTIFSSHDSTRAYFCFSSFSDEPRVWRIDSLYTQPTVTSISGDLPEFLPVNSLQQSPLDTAQFIVGTDYGVYTTQDQGESWQLVTEIPNAPVAEVIVRPADQRFWAFTHGRGIWSGLLEAPVTVTEQLQKIEQVQIYPNPSSDQIRIQGIDAQSIKHLEFIELSSARSIMAIDVNAEWIDIQKLTSGHYVIKVLLADGQIRTGRFLKI